MQKFFIEIKTGKRSTAYPHPEPVTYTNNLTKNIFKL